jgi:glycosyltransferase involved in cell wall biosynthesis
MRVLKIVQAYFPFQDRGGPVFKVRALAKGLAKRGHKITVLTADLGVSKCHDTGISFERCKWGWQANENGVQAFYLSTVAHYRALTFNPRVFEFCASELDKFDLVHFYGLYDLLGPTVSHFCRNLKIPYVIEPMGMYHPIDRSFVLKRVWHLTFGNLYWSNAAQIVATSEMEQQELLVDGVNPNKVVIRYNGIEPAATAIRPSAGVFRAKWGIPSDELVLLFLGRLIPRKGAHILIDAFAQACPNSGHLVIAGPEGETGYAASLVKQASDVGVSSRVSFTGPLYGDAKAAAMADANVFVLPSRYENFANAAAEAIASGVPVIISEACGIRSLVSGRVGLIVAPETRPLADAIYALTSDRPAYERMRALCPSVAAQLSWDRLSEQMEDYYSRALNYGHGNKN